METKSCSMFFTIPDFVESESECSLLECDLFETYLIGGSLFVLLYKNVVL